MPRWNQDAVHHVVDGVLRAYRAYPQGPGSELTELWNSDRGLDVGEECGARPLPHHEETFRFAKGAAPTVARGRVFLPTFSDELLVYGLEPEGAKAEGVAPLQALLTADDPAASFAPGALVQLSVSSTWLPP
jgi:hypothetical protein